MRSGGCARVRRPASETRPMVLLNHELQRRQREIDLVGVVLVHQRDARGAAAHHLARRRREIAEQQPHQGRLAVAVLAQQDDTRLRVDRELGAGKQRRRRPRVAESDAAQLDEVSRQRAARLEGQRHFVVFLERRRRLSLLCAFFDKLLRLLLFHLHLGDVAAAVPVQRGGAGGDEQRGAVCVYARRPGPEARPDSHLKPCPAYSLSLSISLARTADVRSSVLRWSARRCAQVV